MDDVTTQAELRPVFFACGHPDYTGSWWCRTCGFGAYEFFRDLYTATGDPRALATMLEHVR
jgi:hypothetical protein